MELDLRAVVWLLWKPYLERKPQRKRQIWRGPPRDAAYRAWIRRLPCSICAALWRVEAAHTGSDGGMSMKSSDYSCIPLCRSCHTAGKGAYHQIGRRTFERIYGIDLQALVKLLNVRWAAEQRGAESGCQA